MNLAMLITSAGMPRSGSTWLYNAIRLLLMQCEEIACNLSSGHIGQWNELSDTRYRLLKIHTFHPEIAEASKMIFYSYRDIRDAICSQQRKFGGQITIEWADDYINCHEKWMSKTNFAMRYEDMLANKRGIIIQIMELMDRHIHYKISCDNMDLFADKIINEIQQLNYFSKGDKNRHFNKENLFHKNHIIDGRFGAWRDKLDPEIAQQVTEKYSWWLEKYSYPI